MSSKEYINPKSEKSEIIICPYCKGTGTNVEEKRKNWDETDYIVNDCYLCKGKRVVVQKITTEYLGVE